MRFHYWNNCWHGCWSLRPAYAHASSSSRKTYNETRAHGRGSGHFGVRRPLRYLRHHLDLDDTQTSRVAAILNQLKLEREQAALDEKRSLAALADLLTRDDLETAHLRTALDPRLRAEERLQEEFAKGLRELASILHPDQLQRFADMVRSGLITL